MLLRITLTITLLYAIIATVIISILAIEEIDIWILSINGVIMMDSIPILFCLWREDISSWAMLMRVGVIFSVLEIILLREFITTFTSENPYPAETCLLFSVLSLLPIRVIYFILPIAGKKVMEMDKQLL
jgi:hypothetical protein